MSFLPPLPPGYSAQFDAVQNRYFFINNKTGQSSWDFPQTLQQEQQQPPSYSDGPDSKPLPLGWISQFDQASKRPYFVSTATGLSQWEDPRNAIYPPPTSPPPLKAVASTQDSQSTLFATGAVPPSSSSSVLARNPLDGTYYYKPYNAPIIPNTAPIHPQKPPKKPGFFSALLPKKPYDQLQ